MNCSARIAIAAVIGVSITTFIFHADSWAKKAQQPVLIHSGQAVAVKQKIDLFISGMKTEKTGTSGGMDLVKITVPVRATSNAPKACSGAFKVKLEKDTGGSWTYMQQAGVSNLCASTTVSKMATKVLVFNDRVPSDLAGAQKYRAVVDYTNMVDEANESNNVGGVRYMP